MGPALLALALVLPAGSGCSPAPAPRLNVIVVSADTLNRSALRVYAADAPALAHIDGFAQDAVVFSDAHTPASWTLPAHVSLFTGLYPGHHGITRLEQRTTGQQPTMASILLGAGYRTVAFTDGALLDSSHGHAAGFQRYDSEILDPDMPVGITLPRGGARSPASGQDLFDRAIAFLEQRDRGDPPFFMFLHTFAIHDYFYQYADRVPVPEDDGGRASYIDCLVGETICSESEWRHLRARYDAGVQIFDEGFGDLLAALDHAGLGESTLIVLASDHGEGFDPARGRIHHGGRVHEDLIRIPLLARVPGVGSATVDRPVSLVDVLPTLLHVLALEDHDEAGSIPAPNELDGRSAADWIHDPPPAESGPLFATEYAYRWVDGKREYAPGDRPISLAVIRKGLWYVSSPSGEELYSMADDPLQRNNLAPTHEALGDLRLLAAAAAEWSGPAADPAPMDEELLEHLRSLGYVD